MSHFERDLFSSKAVRRQYVTPANGYKRLDNGERKTAATDSDKRTSRSLLYCLIGAFVVFVITLGVLTAVHLATDHHVPVDPLESCASPCPVSTDPCEQWECFVIDEINRCMLSRAATPACAS